MVEYKLGTVSLGMFDVQPATNGNAVWLRVVQATITADYTGTSGFLHPHVTYRCLPLLTTSTRTAR